MIVFTSIQTAEKIFISCAMKRISDFRLIIDTEVNAMDKKFIDWIRKNDWKLELTDENFNLPESIIERYTVSKKWLNSIQ